MRKECKGLIVEFKVGDKDWIEIPKVCDLSSPEYEYVVEVKLDPTRKEKTVIRKLEIRPLILYIDYDDELDAHRQLNELAAKGVNGYIRFRSKYDSKKIYREYQWFRMEHALSADLVKFVFFVKEPMEELL